MVASVKSKPVLPEPRMMEVPNRKYQPTKAELEKETDMPGLSEEQARDKFFRPFRFAEKKN